MATLELQATDPYAFRATVQVHQLGARDPTVRVDAHGIAKAVATPEGPSTIIAAWDAATRRISAELHGPGKGWLEPRLRDFFGLDDDPSALASDDAKVKPLSLRGRGLRLARAPVLFERHAGYVLQQRVTFGEAARVWNIVHRERGEPAPGAPELRVPLTPEAWRRVAAADLSRLGVDNKRWLALMEAARIAARVEAARAEPDRLRRLLMAIPGTGVWTTECVMGFALGDPDALPLGDVHLPHVVSEHWDGDPRGDDRRMVELLEPYRPHRFRIVRWLLAPRYG